MERFHKRLNHEIEYNHPKCSFLINKLKKITKEAYDNYAINFIRWKEKIMKKTILLIR